MRLLAFAAGLALGYVVAVRLFPEPVPASPLRGITKWGGNIAQTISTGASDARTYRWPPAT